MSVKSLWGDIPPVEKIRTPYTILRDQAAVLGELTDHVLEAKVRRVPDPKNFAVVMDIVAPAMDNYAFRLIVASYPVTLYPANLHSEGSTESYECENEEVFVEHLGTILSSDYVRKVVQGLLSQSEVEVEKSPT